MLNFYVTAPTVGASMCASVMKGLIFYMSTIVFRHFIHIKNEFVVLLMKSSDKMTLSDMIDDCIHVNAGSFSYFNSRESD